MMRSVWILVSVIMCSPLYAQLPQTIQIDFAKKTCEQKREETTVGTFYFQTPHTLFTVINKPINQWLIYKDNNIVIYYPDDKKALVFYGRSPAIMPSFQAFLGAMKEDYGLSDMGYTLHAHDVRKDTLVTYWHPPEGLPQDMGEFILTYVGRRLIKVESKNKDDIIKSISIYSGHYEFSGYYFPLEISTQRYNMTDTTFEQITYSNPIFDHELPENIRNFRLPAETKIEEIEW
jgi:hypothetical protein